MVRLSPEHILVVGDRDRRLQSAVATALPAASVTAAATVFDALAELNAGVYSGVLVDVSPIESRPQAAARALREAAGDARLVLFSDPSKEPLSRSLLEHGADDYVVAPAEPRELQQVLATPTREVFADPAPAPSTASSAAPVSSSDDPLQPLLDLPLTDLVLGAMLEQPQRALRHTVQAIAERIAPMSISLLQPEEAAPHSNSVRTVLTHPLRVDDSKPASRLVLEVPATVDEQAAQHALGRLASILSKVQQIDDRQGRLQKLAITDDLTGVYNGRYFKHFLSRILEKARTRRFPVTLFLFDLDNFKKYNDQFGHGVGDEILKQTASLMKRCSRDHDLVARIAGDEFAVVFWEKEGPRQPYTGAPPPSRTPSTPLMIADRFRKMLGNRDFAEFSALGATGKGVLTISGGMAVYPYDARNAEELIDAADKALMFGAKKSGKNSIYLVGGDHDAMADEPRA